MGRDDRPAANVRPRGALHDVVRSGFLALPASTRRAVLHALRRYAPWEDGFDLTPPGPPPGQLTGPPDFVGIGVQKAGTSWWYELITAHPEVSRPTGLHKERHVLSHYGLRPFGAADVDTYHGWFPRRPGQLAGEWTPDYLHLPWVAPLLAEAAPAARLLVLVRDPVERFRSGLAHQRRHHGELTFATASEAATRGFYEHPIAQWLDHFPTEQLLVLQYERCVEDPAGQLGRTYEFLGLSPFRPTRLERRVNAGADGPALHPEVRRRLQELYAADVAVLAKRVPDLDLDRWPNFAAIAAR